MTDTKEETSGKKPLTQERLLDAAEVLFADREFDAVSTREIATRAGAQLALVHYYFGSKEELFRQVLARRVEELSQRRLALLSDYRQKAGGRPISVSRIVEAFVLPVVEFSMLGDEGWKSYIRLNGRVATSDKYLRLAGDLYDPLAQIFIDELARAVGEVSRRDIEWGFLFMVSAMSGAFSESGRIERLSRGREKSSDLRDAYRVLVPFIAAGLRAISKAPVSRHKQHANPV
jgi:AcrR family transcriptional regulator